MRPKTKAELERELARSQEEITELKAELKRAEMYERAKKQGDDAYVILQALIDSGFTRTEAMQFIIAAISGMKK